MSRPRFRVGQRVIVTHNDRNHWTWHRLPDGTIANIIEYRAGAGDPYLIEDITRRGYREHVAAGELRLAIPIARTHR